MAGISGARTGHVSDANCIEPAGRGTSGGEVGMWSVANSIRPCGTAGADVGRRDVGSMAARRRSTSADGSGRRSKVTTGRAGAIAGLLAGPRDTARASRPAGTMRNAAALAQDRVATTGRGGTVETDRRVAKGCGVGPCAGRDVRKDIASAGRGRHRITLAGRAAVLGEGARCEARRAASRSCLARMCAGGPP